MKTKLGALAFVLLLAWPASADQNDTDTSSWQIWQEIGALTNCSAAAINSAIVCGDTRGVKVEGYNALTLEILYTLSAGTGYEFYLETCYEGHGAADCTDATDWYRVAGQKMDTSTGELTIVAGKVTHTAAATDRLTWTIGMNYRRVRLAAFVATGSPDANDKITVNARIGWLQSF